AARAGLHAALAILGCNGGVDAGRRTNLHLAEAQVKRAMLAASAAHLVVAESAKLGVRHLGTIGAASPATTLVTAGAWTDAAGRCAAALASFGARLLRADAGASFVENAGEPGRVAEAGPAITGTTPQLSCIFDTGAGGRAEQGAGLGSNLCPPPSARSSNCALRTHPRPSRPSR